MIKFFRKIRQNLIAENKVIKYVIYAVGEIILVVIGILIAVSINKRMESNKKQEIEIEILTEIRNNLESDLADHAQNMSFIKNRINGSSKLLSNIKTTAVFNDSISTEIWRIGILAPHINPIVTGYNRMLSSDSEIISNDSIRAQISMIYENNYKWLAKVCDEMYLTQTSTLNEMIMEKFIIKESNGLFPKYKPINFAALKGNAHFLTTLEAHMKYWEIVEFRYHSYVEGIEEVIENINKEIMTIG